MIPSLAGSWTERCYSLYVLKTCEFIRKHLYHRTPQLLRPDLLRGELLSHVRLPAAFTLTALNSHAITIYISSPENFTYTYPNLQTIIISTPGTYLTRLDIPAGWSSGLCPWLVKKNSVQCWLTGSDDCLSVYPFNRTRFDSRPRNTMLITFFLFYFLRGSRWRPVDLVAPSSHLAFLKKLNVQRAIDERN